MICISRSNNQKILGLSQALMKVMPENSVSYWDSRMPALRMLSELNPNVFFFTNEDVQKQHIPFIRQNNPNTKLVLMDLANEDYDVDLKIDINNKAGDRHLEYLADETMFSTGIETDSCDFVVISDEHLASNRNFFDWVTAIGDKFKVRIFGSPIPSPYYLGSVNLSELGIEIKSCKGCITFSDNWYHSILYNKVFPIVFNKNPENNDKYIFNNYKELEDICEGVVKGNLAVESEFDMGNTYTNFAVKIIKELSI